MYAMPRKTFRSAAATALLSIPPSSGARSPGRSSSPFPQSLSMTLPTMHHPVPQPSCHSSPGNAIDDDDDEDAASRRRSIVEDFHRLSITPFSGRGSSGGGDRRPSDLPPAASASVAFVSRDEWKRLLKPTQRYALLRKAIGVLHDNRALSSKHPGTARRLRQLNAELRADKSHRVLKFILNALFLLLGLLLLLSVLAAIGYTSTGQSVIF